MTDINDRKAKVKKIVEALKPALDTAVSQLRDLSSELDDDETEADETDGGDAEPQRELREDIDEQVYELESAIENLEGLYKPEK